MSAEQTEELDPEDKRALEITTELAAHFRRVLDGIRTFPKGHVTLRGYYDGLFDKLETLLKEEPEIELRVTPMGFGFLDQVVHPAEKLADSITHALFLDGVQMLTLVTGFTRPEVSRFMEIWRATLDGQLGETHTFSTAFWEANLAGIQVLTLETFSEGGAELGGVSKKTPLQVVVEELSGVGGGAAPSAALAVGGGGRGGRKLVRISREDLQLLKQQGVGELTEEDLKRHDAAQKAPITGLPPDALFALTGELVGHLTSQVERALDALFACALRANEAELLRLEAAFQLVLMALFRTGQMEKAHQNLTRQFTLARSGDPAELELRFNLLTRMLETLKAPALLEPLVAALDEPALAPTALATLRFLPGHTAQVLIEWLSLPETPVARRTLTDLVAIAGPSAEDLVARMGWASAEVALELLHLATTFPGDTGWAVRKAALAHVDLNVQHEAIKGLSKEQLLAHRLELLPLLFSPHERLRSELFGHYVATHDKGVAPALATLLRRVKIEEEEHRRVLLALGQLGGPEACGALRSEFTRLKDVELRCTVAHALGNAGDEKARPLLEEVAGKLFGGGPLKTAAKEALARLDYLRKKA